MLGAIALSGQEGRSKTGAQPGNEAHALFRVECPDSLQSGQKADLVKIVKGYPAAPLPGFPYRQLLGDAGMLIQKSCV